MNKASRFRAFTAVALFAGTVLVAGCGGPDRVTKTTTTDEQTTAPAPVTSSSTTTTTRQTQ
ncbi:MAG: hypothetical protein WDO24_09170 [Pseudomonadota bacterium]